MRRGRENVEKGNSLRVFTFTGVVDGRRVGFPRFSSLSPRNLNRSEMLAKCECDHCHCDRDRLECLRITPLFPTSVHDEAYLTVYYNITIRPRPAPENGSFAHIGTIVHMQYTSLCGIRTNKL
ncbi:PREDICTED: uncharacterized protein LOC108751389 isoform X2 [Trachymyrmex septentrionalis]|uniref:uncharacterized protein LOC108751389 isoform X2 n=1 Tax=Trachymyrmex septentrionalis TaxID=34720 RepID=UPI00084F2E66|nr:PREDICTED: uncharacterized protein LOC108751389 isoform X2 [Trachymyrmex septentrionalis]